MGPDGQTYRCCIGRKEFTVAAWTVLDAAHLAGLRILQEPEGEAVFAGRLGMQVIPQPAGSEGWPELKVEEWLKLFKRYRKGHKWPVKPTSR